MNHETEAIERTLVQFFATVRAEEAGPPNLWATISARLHSESTGFRERQQGPALPLIPRRWVGVAALTLLLALASIALITLTTREARVVSAEQILEKARATATSRRPPA